MSTGGTSATGRDRGSILFLLPACIVIVLILASIAVDMSLVQLRQRQAAAVAAAAADDAATAGTDVVELRQGNYVLDRKAVAAVVDRTIAHSDVASHLAGPPELDVEGDAVRVTLSVTADYLFSGVIPGGSDSAVVTATASATAHEL